MRFGLSAPLRHFSAHPLPFAPPFVRAYTTIRTHSPRIRFLSRLFALSACSQIRAFAYFLRY
jgi:hypothetical protein